ncbi:MAG: ribosomal RNA small subunit methyltransferase A [Candidatus Parcubacteria bacterium]|nr:MAG: ribosomal RNA small subunit methyltransferase A [Candidatus Parcubacteria bacterium]
MTQKRFSQNFLKNKGFLKLIAQNLDINKDDTIIEIGGGHGELTQYLSSGHKIIVYEIDKRLAFRLKNKFKENKNIIIKNQDFLKAKLSLFNNNYKLVGNIPYGITGLIFRKILTLKNKPKILVFTIQKEKAQTMLQPHSLWNNWIKIWGDIQRIAIIDKKNFQPQPKVDSAIIKINFYNQPLVDKPELFIKFLKKIYQRPNKKIKNNYQLPPDLMIYNNLRARQLTFNDLIFIYKSLNKK